MPWSITDIPDQSGRVAVVTGANGGLGLETAEALAGAGAHVVMAVRNQEKAADAHARILRTHPDASLELVPLDLGDQANIKSAIATISRAHASIDLLVNNAGVMAMPERQTADGYEMQFGINHLGHWTFTAGLLANLIRSANAGRKPRVVTVTSVARFMTLGIDPSNPHRHGKYSPWGAYGQAKLANYYFGLGLEREFDRAAVDVASLIAHPGLTHTDLQSHTVEEGAGGLIGWGSDKMAKLAGMSPAAGARMQLRAATDPSAEGGELYGPLFGSNGPAVKRPVLRRIGLEKNIRELWEISERETGVPLDIEAARAEASASE